MKRKDQKVTGAFFLFIALIFIVLQIILDETGYQMFLDNWLFAVFGVVALYFHGVYLSTKQKYTGYLMTGGIMLILCIYFAFESITNWTYTYYMWPVYIFAVLFGFIEVRLVAKKKKTFNTPIRILTCVFVGCALLCILDYFSVDGENNVFIIACAIIGIIFLTKK